MSTISKRRRATAWVAAAALVALSALGCEKNEIDNHIEACDDYCAVSADCDGTGSRECTASCEDMIRVGWDDSRECGDAWEIRLACLGTLSCTEWAEALDDECADGIGAGCHCGDELLAAWAACP